MMKKTLKCDYLIIGAGIIGLSLAYNLVKKNKKIIVIEKEDSLGVHASGRNSGVLHAGFYYTPDSLKALFTKQGNKEWVEYCKKKNLKINQVGKVVVAKNEEELKILHELKSRGDKNGVELNIIDQKELKEIEPNAKTYKYALWSPSTSTVDPKKVLESLKKDLEENAVAFYFSTKYNKKINDNTVEAGDYLIEYDKIINAAGLYSTKIAKDFGFAQNFVILPFKGLYLKYKGPEKFINTNIYPVPNIKNPFLGVHFTLTVDNQIKIGPTATPAFWNENYSGFSNFNLFEFIEKIRWYAELFFTDSNFRSIAFDEIKKYSKSFLIKKALELTTIQNLSHQFYWGEPGIRAQLFNIKTKELVQDFIIEADKNSIHVLNAVSPAFTASLPFTRFIIEKYL